MLYNIVSKTGYALSTDPDKKKKQLVLEKIDPGNENQLWRISPWWDNNFDHQDRNVKLILENASTGLSIRPEKYKDSSPVIQSSVNFDDIEAFFWEFWFMRYGKQGPVGSFIPGPHQDDITKVRVMNAQGDHYRAGTKIIIYPYFQGDDSSNIEWELRPLLGKA